MVYFFKLLGLSLLYLLSGQVGWLFPDAFYTITPLWLPGGVGLVFLYFLGYRYFPAIWIGLFCLIELQGVFPLEFSLLVSSASTLATLTAVVILRNRDFRPTLGRVRDLYPLGFALILFASLSALGGALSVFNFTPGADEVQFFGVFFTWWVGEAIGALIVGTLGFVWWRAPSLPRQRRLEMTALIVGVIGISILCFYNDDTNWVERFQLSFVIFPSLVWAALRFGPHGTTLSTLLIAVIALLGTIQGFGLFSFFGPDQGLFLLQSYLAVISITGLVLSSASKEQDENETELKRANEELQHSLASFSETAKKAKTASQKKSEFLALMSHELRNPLNGVVGFSSLLMDSDLTRSQRDHIGMIRSSGETLLSMIDEILEFSQVDSGRTDHAEDVFSLRRVSKDVYESFRYQMAKKNIAMDFQMEESLPDALLGDHQRLRQVLSNLMANAVKFTEKGSVTLCIRKGEATQVQNAPADESTIVAEFSVEDTGIGIEPEDQERLFAPFSQRNQAIAGRFGGTGLGLVISKNLCDAMGGKIWVKSEMGEGSTFFFAVPLHEPDEGMMDADMGGTVDFEADDFSDIPKMRVLVAEDNATNQRVIHQLLEHIGQQVVIARDGREALDYLKNEDFDVILLDIRMPLIDGYAVAEELRSGRCGSAKRNLPILAVTAHAMVEDRTKAEAAGMNGHLTKPFNLEKLAHAIRSILPLIPGTGPNAQTSSRA